MACVTHFIYRMCSLTVWQTHVTGSAGQLQHLPHTWRRKVALRQQVRVHLSRAFPRRDGEAHEGGRPC